MKKAVILILIVVVMLLMPGCLAEQEKSENTQSIDAMGAFTVMADIPEGYEFTGSYVSDILYVGKLIPQNSEWGRAIITIAFDEEADGISIGDISGDIIDAIIQEDTLTLGEQVEFSTAKTTNGTLLLVYHVKDIEEERFEIYTIYKGYQMRCVIFPGQGHQLTNDYLDMAIAFVSSVWIAE